MRKLCFMWSELKHGWKSLLQPVVYLLDSVLPIWLTCMFGLQNDKDQLCNGKALKYSYAIYLLRCHKTKFHSFPFCMIHVTPSITQSPVSVKDWLWISYRQQWRPPLPEWFSCRWWYLLCWSGGSYHWTNSTVLLDSCIQCVWQHAWWQQSCASSRCDTRDKWHAKKCGAVTAERWSRWKEQGIDSPLDHTGKFMQFSKLKMFRISC